MGKPLIPYFTAIGSDAGIPASTVREYYHLLEDTFLGFLLIPWTKTLKRKALSSYKFYLFDLGVKNILAGIKHIDPQSELYENAFENFIILELRAYLSYRRLHLSLNYWRSTQGHEVDVIIDDDIAIKIKAANKIQDKHLKNLTILAEEKICSRYLLISHRQGTPQTKQY